MIAVFESRRRERQARRDYLRPRLIELGFNIPVTPQGAFYRYAHCSRFTQDSYGFAFDLLARAGVAITLGIDFGRFQPKRHVRFADTSSIEKLTEGVDRLHQALG